MKRYIKDRLWFEGVVLEKGQKTVFDIKKLGGQGLRQAPKSIKKEESL